MSTTLSLADLESYDRHGSRSKHERRFLCPMCGDDKPRDTAHRSLALNMQSGAWLCHRCREQGKLKDFWIDSPLQTKRERENAAINRAFAVPPKTETPEKREAATDPSEAWAASVVLEGTAGASYLERRGLPAGVAHKAGVRFSLSFFGRPAVLFPVQDKAGTLIAVSGRFVDGRNDLKTMAAGSKSLGVFMTPGAFSSRVIAVCESPIDALSLWLCGIAAVALVGTSAPGWLPSVLAFKHVLLATDNDQPDRSGKRAGDEAAAKLAIDFDARGSHTFRLRPRGGKDWSEILESRGVESLRTHLTAFSETVDTEARTNAAFALLQSGRTEAAAFVASLIEDSYARAIVSESLRRSLDKTLN